MLVTLETAIKAEKAEWLPEEYNINEVYINKELKPHLQATDIFNGNEVTICPHLEDLTNWLREVKCIDVIVTPTEASLTYYAANYCYKYMIIDNIGNDRVAVLYEEETNSNRYNDVLELGVRKALDYLIRINQNL